MKKAGNYDTQQLFIIQCHPFFFNAFSSVININHVDNYTLNIPGQYQDNKNAWIHDVIDPLSYTEKIKT